MRADVPTLRHFRKKIRRFSYDSLRPADLFIVAAKVRVTCSVCGDQEVDPKDVRARLCVDTQDAEYHFTCTVCESTVVKTCNQQVLDALASLKVTIDRWAIPQIPPRVYIGADISDSDIVDFREGLSDEDRFEQALSDLIS